VTAQGSTIFRKVHEPPGHALGLAAMDYMHIAVACSCGYEDTWEPYEDGQQVARRFNAHVAAAKP